MQKKDIDNRKWYLQVIEIAIYPLGLLLLLCLVWTITAFMQGEGQFQALFATALLFTFLCLMRSVGYLEKQLTLLQSENQRLRRNLGRNEATGPDAEV